MMEKFQVAISKQSVVLSTSCFVLGWVFGDGGSNGAISSSNKSKMAAAAIFGCHLGKVSNGHISATGRPIHFMFGYIMGFRGRRI